MLSSRGSFFVAIIIIAIITIIIHSAFIIMYKNKDGMSGVGEGAATAPPDDFCTYAKMQKRAWHCLAGVATDDGRRAADNDAEEEEARRRNYEMFSVQNSQ